MAIRIKHAPSAVALGETAYTIGRGAKRERDRRFGADVYFKYRNLLLQEQGLEQQAERAAEVSRIADEQLGLRREELGYKQEGALAEREFAERKWQEEPARQLQKSLQEQERLRENITWQYDESQKRAMAHIITGIAWVREQVAAGKWTAEQGEEAERQLWQKYYSITPLPAYDDEPTAQMRLNSSFATGRNGELYIQKGNGDWEPVGMTSKDQAELYIDLRKAMHTQDATGEDTTDNKLVKKGFLELMTLISQIQGLPGQVEEEQKRQQARQEQEVAEKEQQEEEMNAQARIEALPVMFNRVITGQPKIGRIKKGKPSRDMIYGEEAYNKALRELIEIGTQQGVRFDIIKAEFNKWWDAQYEKERGQRFQKFANRMEFEAAPARGRAKMRAPNGEIYEVDPSEVEEAEKHGWVVF